MKSETEEGPWSRCCRGNIVLQDAETPLDNSIYKVLVCEVCGTQVTSEARIIRKRPKILPGDRVTIASWAMYSYKVGPHTAVKYIDSGIGHSFSCNDTSSPFLICYPEHVLERVDE
jgi:hypothetical protein